MQTCLESTNYGLAIHTSSPQLGLALSNFAGDSRSSTWDLGRDLSTHLHQQLVEFLTPQTWADLAFIAVAKGPGSFTSNRIGVVTARTLAQQLDIPLFATSTLATFAWSQQSREAANLTSEVIALQMDARRGQLFVAIYQVSSNNPGLTQWLPDTVMTPDAWKQALNALETPYQLIDVPAELGTTVTSLLELAYLDWKQEKRPHWSEALPFYGQHPVDSP